MNVGLLLIIEHFYAVLLLLLLKDLSRSSTTGDGLFSLLLVFFYEFTKKVSLACLNYFTLTTLSDSLSLALLCFAADQVESVSFKILSCTL